MSAAESDAMLQRIHAHFAQHGYGLWTAELRATGECIGYIGLNIPRFQLPFSPCVEIGWRLAAAHWNQGLATEGALAAMECGFQTLGLSEIVSFTTPANLPEAHPLRRHILYRRSRNG
jgi:RimJ/RimL family protein N-acetyltransferase